MLCAGNVTAGDVDSFPLNVATPCDQGIDQVEAEAEWELLQFLGWLQSDAGIAYMQENPDFRFVVEYE